MRAGTPKPVLCDWSVVQPAYFAVIPPGRNNVLMVRAFIDHLSKALGRDPYWDRDLPLERFRTQAA